MGRIVIANMEFNGRKIALIAADTPNVLDGNFYNLLTTKMLELTDYSSNVGAEFNAVWDPAFDRSNATSSGE